MIKRMCMGLALAVLLLGVLTGCVSYASPIIPPNGLVYSNISAPQSIGFNKTQFGAKQGEASSESILGLVAWGDCSARAAAQSAGINQINHTDYHFKSILGIYNKYTTVVYGE